MEIKTQVIDEANAKASGFLAQKDIEEKVQTLAKEAAKTIKKPGFRQGKVPVAMVLKEHKDGLVKQAEQEILSDCFKQALKNLDKKQEDLIGEPFFDKFDRKEDGIDVEFTISFNPKVDLSGYEKYIPEYKKPRILKKDIAERKEKVLKQYATPESSKKEALEEGLFAKFDFEGFMDGKPFDGGKAENYILEIGSKQFIPGFEEGMIGLKKGEEKDIKVTFPAEYGAEHLAGKEAVFKVKVHDILEKKTPKITEELLKQMMIGEENPTEEKLDESIKKNLESEKFYQALNDNLKMDFANAMVDNYDFALPINVVEQETNLQLNNAWRTFSEQELEEFKNDPKKLDEKRESFKEEAKKSVKLTFIINELAKLRKIDVNNNELYNAIAQEAFMMGVDPREHVKQYSSNPQALAAVRMAIIEEKLFVDIFKKDDKKEEKEEE